jgi:hypothetical protein
MFLSPLSFKLMVMGAMDGLSDWHHHHGVFIILATLLKSASVALEKNLNP